MREQDQREGWVMIDVTRVVEDASGSGGGRVGGVIVEERKRIIQRLGLSPPLN